MSLEKAEKFLEDKGYGDRIILIDAPTATVAIRPWRSYRMTR